MEEKISKKNTFTANHHLWLLRGAAVAMFSIAIFLFVTSYTIKIEPNCAEAQCVAVGPLNTGTLDGTAKGSPEQTALIGMGCMRLNNADYVGGQWMSCPQGYYMAAITDDNAAAQDAFCCPFMI